MVHNYIYIAVTLVVLLVPTLGARASTDGDPNPYCDQVGPNFKGNCHDRLDTDENDVATCNDGSHEKNWQDCKDATGHNEDCADEGYDDGRNGKFNRGDCGDQYEEEFMKGCLSVSGNTKDVCENATHG